jgi:antitoxin component of MazEF toxin-antitoxin module
MFDKFAADIGTGVIEVPLPPSVIQAFGCRPGTSISLHIVDGQIRVLPTPVTPAKLVSTSNDASIADLCWTWWKSQ